MNSFEPITVSPEWARKLKEAGWHQNESILTWWVCDPESDSFVGERPAKMHAPDLAAPTAEEILRKLPIKEPGFQCKDVDSFLTIFPYGERRWQVSYTEEGVGHHIKFDELSLANAAAAMWCYLKEHNLLLPIPQKL